MPRSHTALLKETYMSKARARFRAALPCAALILLALPVTASGAVYRGTAKADHLIGSAKADTLSGRAGADVLDGRGGRDRVFGGAGSDRIVADGRDRVSGGAGADKIEVTTTGLGFRVACGAGRDQLTVTGPAGLTKKAVRAHASGCDA